VHTAPTAGSLIADSLPAIADAMVERSRRIDTSGNPERILEANLKAVVRDVIAQSAAEVLGLVVERSERAIRRPEWPRVGRVDLTLAPLSGHEAAAFVELKWGYRDALWNCVWDVAKCAMASRLGLASEALILAGFGDEREWAHPKYGALLTTREWSTADFQRYYSAEWWHWARPPRARERHPTGPYRLPAAFATTLLERHPFEFDGAPWSLGVVDVRALGDDWIELDEAAQPVD
jgi:hypothetical protein